MKIKRICNFYPAALSTVPMQFVNAFENFKNNLENGKLYRKFYFLNGTNAIAEEEHRVINFFTLTVYSQLFSR